MEEKFTIKQDILDNDELNYVIKTYGEIIEKYIGIEIGIGFFSSSEDYVDTYQSIKNTLHYKGKYNKEFDITIFNDYSISEKNVITDIGIATLELDDKSVATFIKVVTPFLRERTYDFLIMKYDQSKKILQTLDEKRKKSNFKINDFPIIGLDFTDIKKNTIDFLLNEDFRTYCTSKHIKLKRGIVLEGKPGSGKTMTIQYLKNIALANKIEFYSFKNADDFVKNQNDYEKEEKKIFVFEDFDTLLRERKDTNRSPNQILGMILNTLEGVDEINNVVSIFTTNEVRLFDSAFIRPGRIDKVYTYSLPDQKIYKDFFNAYIPEEATFHSHIEEILSVSNSDISFAILKGICDDINILKFSDSSLTKQKIDLIIKEKLSAANKQEEVKSNKDYIL